VSRLFKEFNGRTVLVTGHTGFKGSWLSLWLNLLGARVVGLSIGPPTNPSHFVSANLESGLIDKRVDLRNADGVDALITEIAPDFVFHLGAQALVSRALKYPLETFQTNVIGTANLLSSICGLSKKCVAVIITSDKCYENQEWTWGYREIDRLGGKDPYSASKSAAEMVIRSYLDSILPGNSKVQVGVARAGNVIGGGDWAPTRIVPDCMRAWSVGVPVTLRSPGSTRPWQHVLEPLSGYLMMAAMLQRSPELHKEAFNFGPNADQDKSVQQLVEMLSRTCTNAGWRSIESSDEQSKEAGLLKLNCDKAIKWLSWRSTLDFEETVGMTGEWYDSFYSETTKNLKEISTNQIAHYCELAKRRGLAWAE
jgi:CDP-glucose 4,6-dehydratase